MITKPSSASAVRVAEVRAAHQLIDGEPKILEDPVVVALIDESVRERIRQNAIALKTPEFVAFRSHIVTRSRFAEDQLEDAVRRGIDQYVILGAGLDTFAWRQPPWARRLGIFEVDHRASQETKKELLASAHFEAAANLEFVEIDFESESIRDGLIRTRFDLDRPAFFCCLGVMMFLSESAVDDLFRFIGSLAKSSEIVFSYSSSDSPVRLLSRAGRLPGESFRSHFDEETLDRKLRDKGFSTVLFPSRLELSERYFRGRTDLPAPEHPRIGRAIV